MAQPGKSSEELVEDLTSLLRNQAAAAQQREEWLVSMMQEMLRGQQGQMQAMPAASAASAQNQNLNVNPLKLPVSATPAPHPLLVRLTSGNFLFGGTSLGVLHAHRS